MMKKEIKVIVDDIQLITNFLDITDFDIIQDIKENCKNVLTINNKPLTRLGCFQADTKEATPWLRCPSIENQNIEEKCKTSILLEEQIKNLGYETNIYKLQEYLHGEIIIYAHTDKIIDLDENTPIFIYRAGATRTCKLVNKLTKEVITFPIPHNSLLSIPYESNLIWKHGINQDITDEPSYSIVARKSITFKYLDYVYGKNTPFKNEKDIINRSDKYWSAEKQKNEIVKIYGLENKNKSDISMYKDIIENCIYA